MKHSVIIQRLQPWNSKQCFLPVLWVVIVGPLWSHPAIATNAEQSRPEIVKSSSEQDMKAAAQHALEVAEQLRSEGTAPALKLALEEFQQALQLWRELGDRSSEASTLDDIGRVYNLLGEKQEALDNYSQALLIERAPGDRSAEAMTLNNIGVVYHSLLEEQKALNCTRLSRRYLRFTGGQTENAGVLHSGIDGPPRLGRPARRSQNAEQHWRAL